MEAYGSYEEILARGVELMQLIKAKDEDDDREIFSVHGEDEDEEEGEREEGEEGEDQEANDGVQLLVSPCAPNSPYKRRNIIYITESQSNLAFSSVKPSHLGDDLKQFPPDSASIYSAHSMLSIHSAVEAESSRHEDEKEVRDTASDPITSSSSLHSHRRGSMALLQRRKVMVQSLSRLTTAISELAEGFCS